jgi:fumarate reductase flavoprotein subunit
MADELILPARGRSFSIQVPVVVIGAGACGLIAALTARDAGAEVLVIERDRVPGGSTALSSGFIPACRTRWQRQRAVVDTIKLMSDDILRKSKKEADPILVEVACESVGPTLEWLADAYSIPFVLVEGFLYPGHSVMRMHAHTDRTGAALVGALAGAVAQAGIDVMTEARVTHLFADDSGQIVGVRVARPDGGAEAIGCRALVLASSGYGGDPALVRELIPDMAEALYFGHVGNQGDALKWGRELGALTRHLGAYQGHGSVATPHNALITWALMMEGGIQVNAAGRRFSNEHQGYSEQAVAVIAQPGGVAWDVYDARRHELGMQFEDYRDAVAAGAVHEAATVDDLARLIGCPVAALAETLAETAGYAAGNGQDPFGRDFKGKAALEAPYRAVKVTGALFHTQGGLMINPDARVIRPDGRPLPNLFAGGGAACGLSGSAVWGYLSGNGLLTAFAFGGIAGDRAGRLATA